MNNQFKNLSFNGSTNLKNIITDQLVKEVGKHAITLSNSEYGTDGGYRPYQLIVERHENGDSSIMRLLECVANQSNDLVMSNLFDFEAGEYSFEYVGKLKETQISKGELEEVYNLFTNNLASFFEAGCYDNVEVKK